MKNASINAVDKNQWTPLHCAASNGHLDVLTVLTNAYGVDVDAQTDSGSSVMHYLMRISTFNSPMHKDNYLSILNILRGKGASLNLATTNGFTPLHEAASRGNIVGSQWLIEQGAKVNACTKNGLTPVHLAVQANSLPCVKLLVEHRADPTHASPSGTPLEMASRGDPAIVQYLQQKASGWKGVVPSSKPANPALRFSMRRNAASRYSTKMGPLRVDLAKPPPAELPPIEEEDEDEEEVIYTLDEQEQEEDIPGSHSAVIPLGQRRQSTIFNNNTRQGLSVIFTKPPLGGGYGGGSPFGAPMGGGPIKPVPGPGGAGMPKRVMPARGAPVASPTIPVTSPGQVRRGSPLTNGGPSRAVEAPKRVPSGPLPPTRGAPGRGRGSRRDSRPMASSDGGAAVAVGAPPRGGNALPPRGAAPARGSSPGVPRGRRGGPPGAAPAGGAPPAAAPVGHKFCIECGVPRVPGSKFCGECGFRF